MEDKRTEEEKVISALEQMKEAYFTILEFSGNKKVDKAFNGSPATDVYPKVFSGSFEDIDMPAWCDEMIEAISG